MRLQVAANKRTPLLRHPDNDCECQCFPNHEIEVGSPCYARTMNTARSGIQIGYWVSGATWICGGIVMAINEGLRRYPVDIGAVKLTAPFSADQMNTVATVAVMAFVIWACCAILICCCLPRYVIRDRF